MSIYCNNQSVFNYLFFGFKYVIPCIFLLIGIIKFVYTSKWSKAIKSFFRYFFISIIIFSCVFLFNLFLKKSCITYNNNGDDLPISTDSDDNSVPDNDSKEVTNNEEVSKEEKFKMELIDGITYVDGIMIVNKTYSIPSSFRPSNSGTYDRCNSCLTKETMDAFNAMKADATALGLNVYISSGFRSYEYQNKIYNNYVRNNGQVNADKYSARPGHSEHQTGLAFDLNSIDDSFANTAEGKWVQDNCYKYGLILRYPKGKESLTGYNYESWHLRYVGVDLALKLYNDGDWITLEEYFNLTSSYEQ